GDQPSPQRINISGVLSCLPVSSGELISRLSRASPPHQSEMALLSRNQAVNKTVFSNPPIVDFPAIYTFLKITVLSNSTKNGEKVVIFDEELVKEGSEKWKYTVCGYFVGYRMGINELIYNIRRMWGKHGLKDSVVDADGMCYFKFKNEEGMNFVIDQSPCALASRLGRPIKMDQVTVDMCRVGTGSLGYPRVLIEINAEDECDHCKVFGHSVYNCVRKPKPKTSVHNIARPNTGEKNVGEDKEGFVDVISRKNNNRRVWNKEHQGNKQLPGGVKRRAKKWLIVDEFIKKKLQPTCEETKDWNYDMITYFKLQWEAMERHEMESSDEEDVF
ncbi:hypothetical protein Tco_0787183, partial [Tanacetum coccineum]